MDMTSFIMGVGVGVLCTIFVATISMKRGYSRIDEDDPPLLTPAPKLTPASGVKRTGVVHLRSKADKDKVEAAYYIWAWSTARKRYVLRGLSIDEEADAYLRFELDGERRDTHPVKSTFRPLFPDEMKPSSWTRVMSPWRRWLSQRFRAVQKRSHPATSRIFSSRSWSFPASPRGR